MERLTIRNDNLGLEEISFINPNDPEGMYNILDLAKYSESENGAESGVLLDISTKLAEYENTGFAPDEITDLVACLNVDDDGFSAMTIARALIELVGCQNLKYEGKLIELPCKVGDTVYLARIDVGTIEEGKICSFTKYKDILTMQIMLDARRTEINVIYFGQTVFLTCQEAENALENLKK